MYLIDTDVAVHVRDGTPEVVDRIRRLDAGASLSLLTLVELEGGIAAVPELATRRRGSLAALLANFPIMPFERSMVSAYSDILAARGFSRRRVIDRLIAATAIVNGLTLITMNGEDFRDIPGLALLTWPAPAQ